MNYKSSLLLLLVSCIMANSSFGQVPQLKIANDANSQQYIRLHELKTEVHIAGNIATTVMTMTFENLSDRILEGELTFPMPEGVSVSRYALDINGRLREAVPVEKAKATEVFESIEHRNVDPGLLEKVEGNNFRTRIYPLPAHGMRTVLIGYEQELSLSNELLKYYLPLDYPARIPIFSLNVTVADIRNKPELKEQPDGSFIFEKKGNCWSAALHKSDYLPRQSLEINIPKSRDIPEAITQLASGNNYFFMVNAYPKTLNREKVWGDRIGIIWDVSLSGLKRDIAKELDLLDKVISSKRSMTVEVSLLNHIVKTGRSFIIKNGSWGELRSYLENLTYDGGTDYSKLTDLANAEEYLLFSDGISTFGDNTMNFKKPVYCINSSLQADYSTLKNIAVKSGGHFINLNNKNAEEAFSELSNDHLQFIGIKNAQGLREIYPSIPTSVNGHISLAGISDAANKKLVLQFGHGRKVLFEQEVMLQPAKDVQSVINLEKIWVQKKITELDIDYDKNKDEISDLGKQFSIVTRNTSLIVLESIEDYYRYQIQPPAELREAYNRMVKEGIAEKEQRQNNLLTSAFSMQEVLKEWWDTKFTVKKYYARAAGNEIAADATANYVTDRQATPAAAPPPPPPDPISAQQTVHFTPPVIEADGKAGYEDRREAEMEEVVTYSTSNIAAAQTIEAIAIMSNKKVVSSSPAIAEDYSGASIEIPEFKSDKDYMRQFNKGMPLHDAYKQYLLLRKDYITTPTFYFTMASWFYQQKDTATGLMILSNIADLQLENADLYKMLAYKLKQTGNYKEAVFITKKVLGWRPMDAQSYRDHALALADNGQYQPALDTLYAILLKSYSPETDIRDDGIEEVILMEINNLIALHVKHLNTSKIDKRLITAFPIDIRVVLNWNKNDTDIDLWVTDPNGEKCFYSNKETSSGGRISNDFTDGYGPEQFLLKKAVKGEYTIQTNYFGDSQLTISGPTTLMAEIYLHYSNGKQERRIVVLQSDEQEKGDGIMIGKFTF